MYTILITDANELVATKRERIMQRSKLVDTLHFLTDQLYKEQDMSLYTVSMEYHLPVSGKYRCEILTLSDELYENKLEYKLPIDTDLTAEKGEVEIQLTFLLSDLDEAGRSIQRVRKTSPCTLTIVPIAAWADVIPDSVLTPLDQRLIKQDAQIKALDEFNQFLVKNKADNLVFTDDKLQLTSQGKRIGDAVTIPNAGSILVNGVPATEFDDVEGTPGGGSGDDSGSTPPSGDQGSVTYAPVVEF